MIDEAESFVTAAKLLKERGAYKILVMVTHGLLSANAPELIEESAIDEVRYNNSHDTQHVAKDGFRLSRLNVFVN